MKTIKTKYLLTGFFMISFVVTLNAQNGNCVQCSGSSSTGSNASAIGKNTIASGNNAFAGGYNSQASGSNSLAFGYNSKATQSTNIALGNTALSSGTGSVAIGNYVKASAQNSFVFGSSSSSSYPLTNNTANSIAFGVNSNKPTMLITKALGNNYTGKVSIGSVSEPQAKLHIKSDYYEDAGLILEPIDQKNQTAFVQLYDDEHRISVDGSLDLKLSAGSGAMNFQGDNYCFGNTNENKTRFYTKGNPVMYYNVQRIGGQERRDGIGPSYAVEFKDDAIRIRTASYYQSGDPVINNWRNAVFITNDGKIGIGSNETFLSNNADQNLIVQSPQAMELQSSNITLSGKIGINTVNNVSDYALAVDGGLISTKVYIKEVNHWPDHVFSEDYQLLRLDDLKSYLSSNKHLPGIPSEQEVVKHGYDVHEMQYLMLEKIEELARYILLLQDEIDLLKNERMEVNDSIRFTYDANGNRISRSLIFQKIVNPDQKPATTTEECYELFPNPTSAQFSVVTKEPQKEPVVRATLLTLSGVVIEEKYLLNVTTSFDLSGKANGVYILEINGPDGNQAWKVIKQ